MNTRSILTVAALVTIMASPLAAWQAPAADSTAAPTASPPRDSATTMGPRVRAAIPQVQAYGASREPVRRDTHTLRITTLALVLAVVILVLLIT